MRAPELLVLRLFLDVAFLVQVLLVGLELAGGDLVLELFGDRGPALLIRQQRVRRRLVIGEDLLFRRGGRRGGDLAQLFLPLDRAMLRLSAIFLKSPRRSGV
jgi:hypothetical protein